MSFLVDTCTIADFAVTSPDPSVEAWFAAQAPERLFLSALTIGEIEKGLALLESGRKQRALAQWLVELRALYGGRILPVDEAVATIWGRITAHTRRRGRSVKTVDGLIAATALRHSFFVVTRNVADFENTGVSILNPWQ